MKNKSKYNKLQMQINNILEVRLDYGTWNKIRVISSTRRTSYSWVVRYFVFRFINRKDIQNYLNGDSPMVTKFSRVSDVANSVKMDSKNKHRHRLCLYGNDELMIRLTAVRLGCTMSHLIRLALMFYLPDIWRKFPSLGRPARMNYYDNIFWYWLGIKSFKDVKFPTSGVGELYFKLIRYDKKDYW